MTSKKVSSQSFRDAYEVLQRHATSLRNQTEPNIDDLLNIVNESVAAYKLCKARIDAVEKALQQALDDPELSELSEETDAEAKTEQEIPPFVDSDPIDDIPF